LTPVNIATDITVDLEDRPHALAAFVETMAAAGVEIEGFCGLYADGAGIDHVLVDDLPTARQALSELGMRITGERSVLVLDVDAKTFEFARCARRLASAGVDVDLVYLATRGRLVLGVDDIADATAALDGFE
jgi:hypothetical protein